MHVGFCSPCCRVIVLLGLPGCLTLGLMWLERSGCGMIGEVGKGRHRAYNIEGGRGGGWV